ncbi:MAG: carboxypeptidase-like regulatory domain-containing protein, partial [Deltaproteobacteria bacterium]
MGIAALLSGCSAGGNGLASGDGSSSNSPSARGPVLVPVGDAPPPLLDTPAASTMADFIGDDEVLPADGAVTRVVRRRGLVQRQVTCPGGGTTSVSGTVYIPSGQLPLYNAMVYVPDADLRPFTPGASCSCEITGDPIATALTDSKGHFVLPNVPVGVNIPLVIQVGDWRRELNIGTVEACTDNPVADKTLRLPSRQSQGDIPKIAVATGRLDALECLIRKLGVDESEFTGERGGGRVTLFAGEGGTARYATLNEGEAFPPAQALWNDLESLARYDVVLMSCDGDRDNVENKSERSFEAMYDYLNQGGRVFGSHYQGVWLERGPAPLPALAEFENQADLGDVSAQVVTTFPKGQALSEWLVNAG